MTGHDRQRRIAGPGVEPGSAAYETAEVPFFYPTVIGLLRPLPDGESFNKEVVTHAAWVIRQRFSRRIAGAWCGLGFVPRFLGIINGICYRTGWLFVSGGYSPSCSRASEIMAGSVPSRKTSGISCPTI